MATLSEERFHVWLRGLPPERLAALSAEYARLAFEGGLAVVREGTARPIPPALTPVVADGARLAARAALARGLLSGLVKAARYLMTAAPEAERGAVLAGLSPWERALCSSTWRAGEAVAIARADLFTGEDGADRPLEMNATIPAMQGYSDIAAQAFLRAVGRAAELSRDQVARMSRENGSNCDDLRRSLLAHYARLGGAGRSPVMAIVARSGDPQCTELAALCANFRAAGVDAQRCTPEQIRLDERGRATLLRHPVDLIYRHIFARRIDPESDLGRIAREPEKHRLLNPVNSQLEMKSLFAELSAAAAGEERADAFGLFGDERDAASAIPWTRRLAPGDAVGPSGERLGDLPAFVAENGGRLVIKRSWGYGGTSVVLGDDLASPEGQARAREVVGREGGDAVSWEEVVGHCAARGGYIVQERVALSPSRHLVALPEGPKWQSWYVDVSAYTNLGAEPAPAGAVCRGSAGRIVNIVGGGGLVPVIRDSVMEELLAALGV